MVAQLCADSWSLSPGHAVGVARFQLKQCFAGFEKLNQKK